eukprot:SAG31_NODE_533_length_14371_cov_6.455367_3_plen_88_part_00
MSAKKESRSASPVFLGGALAGLSAGGAVGVDRETGACCATGRRAASLTAVGSGGGSNRSDIANRACIFLPEQVGQFFDHNPVDTNAI